MIDWKHKLDDIWSHYGYTNFHELNLDYFIKVFTEIFEEWASLYNQLITWKESVDTEIESLLERTEILVSTYEQWVETTQANTDAIESLRASLDYIIPQVTTLNENVKNKVNMPKAPYSQNGQIGQVLSSLGNGETQWVERATVSDAQAETYITAWLNDHPEATTTVQDHSLEEVKLVVGALGYVTPEMFDAVDANGNIDITKFQNMFSFAGTYNKYVRFNDDYTLNFIENSTQASPTRIEVVQIDNLLIDGCGHTLYMTGLTREYQKTVEDVNSSAADFFTGLSFRVCNNLKIINLNIKGEYEFQCYPSDADTPVDSIQGPDFLEARSSGILLRGCSKVQINDCSFDGLMGNAIQMKAGTRTDSANTVYCTGININNCYFTNCLENACNNMAGVEGVTYNNLVFYNNRQGIETAVIAVDDEYAYPQYGIYKNYRVDYGSVISNCIFIDNYIAFIANGWDDVSNCAVFCGTINLNSGSRANISNCTLMLSRYILCVNKSDTSGCKVNIDNCYFMYPKLDTTWNYNNPYYWHSDNKTYIYYKPANAQKNDISYLNIKNCRFELGDDFIALDTTYNKVTIEGCQFIGYDETNNRQILGNSTQTIYIANNDNLAYISGCCVGNIGDFELADGVNLNDIKAIGNYYWTNVNKTSITNAPEGVTYNDRFKLIVIDAREENLNFGATQFLILTSRMQSSAWVTNYNIFTRQYRTNATWTAWESLLSGKVDAIASNGRRHVADADFTGSSIINSSTGGVSGSTTENCVTDYIEIPTGCNKMKYSRKTNTQASGSAGIAFYNSSRTFISGSGITNLYGSDSVKYVNNTVDIPSNAKYVRFTAIGTNKSDFFYCISNQVGLYIDTNVYG